MTSGRATAAIVVGFGLIGLAAAAPVPAAPTDDQLLQKAAKLNEITGGEEALQAALTDLLKDKDAGKRMVKLAAKKQADAPDKDKPYKFNAALVLGKVAHNVKEYDIALEFYQGCFDTAAKLQNGSKLLLAYDGMNELLWAQKKYQAVEELNRKLLDMNGGEDLERGKPFILEKMILAKAKQGDTDEALRMVEGLVNLDQGGWYFLTVKGQIQREAGKLADAIETYEQALTNLSKAKKLEAEQKARFGRNLKYVLSGLHVENNDIDKAAEQLQALIKDDPENPTYYNDLGFIWADHDMKFAESEKLIRKALELDAAMRKKLLADGKIDADLAKKENAAYQDSLGWVLFKLKKYDEAKKYLVLASQDDEEGKHIEIWDHLADCLYAMGDKKGAVETWTKSLKFEDVSKRDKDRRKKVTEKLKKAKAELGK